MSSRLTGTESGKMKIAKNHIVENKTRLYLLPGLRHYGEEFRGMINKMFKLGFGIGDELYEEHTGTSKEDLQAIFILVDTTVNRNNFIKGLEFFREQQYFIADYEFDDMVDGYQHMLVLRVPDKDTFKNFMLSAYSKMYRDNKVKEFFKKDSTVIGVLARDENVLRDFVDKLNEDFDEDFDYREWPGELEYPWKTEDETF